MQDAQQHWEDALGRRLAWSANLSEPDIHLLRTSSLGVVREARPRRDIVREGDVPKGAILIVDGWAAEYKSLDHGRRQLIAFLIPGDVCDLNNVVLRRMDYSIGALTPIRYVEVAHEVFRRLIDLNPRIAQALRAQLLTGMSVQREWIVNIGQRSAIERISHLFCELFYRMRAVGLAESNRLDFPITQQDIAEATGLTSVHVNRTLREMRAENLILLHDRVLEIPDFRSLSDVALFTPTYLHLCGDGELHGTAGGD